MATTLGYTPIPTPLLFEHEDGRRSVNQYIKFGGWNRETQQLSPIRAQALLSTPLGESALSWVFDCLAAATEAGAMTPAAYISQLFASSDDLHAFVESLGEDVDIYWVNDRHFRALEWLGHPEDRLSSYSAIAELLIDDASEIGW
jgi:hypothetical protein